MKRIFTTVIICCLCAIVGICGINKTLNAAQSLFQSASTVDQYQKAKKKFQSAKTDVGYIPAEHDNAISEGIRKCDRRINELSPRLSVNGSSSATNISFSAAGGSKTLSISTNQGSPNVTLLPTWLRVTSQSSNSLTIYCDANSRSSSREDWFNVDAGSKTVRVNVTQAGNSSSSSSSSSNSRSADNGSHSANIESVWIEQNVSSDGKQGLNVHAKFSVAGMKGKDGKVAIYFYDSSYNAIKDTNGRYCTAGDNPVVATHEDFSPGYDNSIFNDFKVFIPYSELHQTGTSPRTLNVNVVIWDYSSSDHKELAEKERTSFSFTPQSDSYLMVDNKTAVSTSFSASGGSETFYVSTDADSWTTWGIPSFCEVTNKTSTSFTLKCNPNNGSERSDYMKIKTGNHEVRIDISQSANPKKVSIDRVWVDHNVFFGLSKGMKIHAHISVAGYNGSKFSMYCFFYYEDNTTPLRNPYGGQVQVSTTGNVTYDNAEWTDLTFNMPYSSLNMGRGWSGTLSFDLVIKDSSGNVLAREDNNSFTYSQY